MFASSGAALGNFMVGSTECPQKNKTKKKMGRLSFSEQGGILGGYRVLLTITDSSSDEGKGSKRRKGGTKG